MDTSAADVSATVGYSVDKWMMARVPWALWACAAGLAVALHAPGRGVAGAALAFVYLALLGVAFAGWALTTLIEKRSGLPLYAVLPIVIFVAVLVAAVIAVFVPVGRTYGIGTMWWGSLIDPPPHVFGWMLIYLGAGWVAFAIYRHVEPGRPVVTLSPAGISYHRSWLRDVFIPWREVHRVGHLDLSDVGTPRYPGKNPNAIVAVVTDDFYARRIAPKQSFFAPLGSEAMFRPRGATMQMVLTSPEIVIDPEDLRAPMEARWTAFRDRPATAIQLGGQPRATIVHGRWSFEGSWRQALHFLAPLVAAAAVALHAVGAQLP